MKMNVSVNANIFTSKYELLCYLRVAQMNTFSGKLLPVQIGFPGTVPREGHQRERNIFV